MTDLYYWPFFRCLQYSFSNVYAGIWCRQCHRRNKLQLNEQNIWHNEIMVWLIRGALSTLLTREKCDLSMKGSSDGKTDLNFIKKNAKLKHAELRYCYTISRICQAGHSIVKQIRFASDRTVWFKIISPEHSSNNGKNKVTNKTSWHLSILTEAVSSWPRERIFFTCIRSQFYALFILFIYSVHN